MRSPHEGPYVWNRNNVEHATNPSQQNLVNRKQQVMRDRVSGTEARLQWLEAGVAATLFAGNRSSGLQQVRVWPPRRTAAVCTGTATNVNSEATAGGREAEKA